MKLIKQAMLALVMLAWLPLAQAGELTDNDVQRWLKAMPTLTSWLEQHDDKLGGDSVMQESETMDQVFEKGVEQLRKEGLYDDFNKQAKQQGFASVEEWATVSRDISLAFMAIELQDNPASEAQMQAQLEQLSQAEGIPAEEKAMMEGMMKASIMMVKAAKQVPANNIKIVKAHADEIARQFNEDDGEHDHDH